MLAQRKVSIVIPVLNCQDYLVQNIETILAQSYTFDELIYVDNGSSDNSVSIIQKFFKSDPRIKLCFCAKRGRGAPRNVGIKVATGDIIVCSDADCFYPENWLESLLAPILLKRAGATQGAEISAQQTSCAIFIQKENEALLWRQEQLAKEGTTAIDHVDTKNFAILASLLPKDPFNSELNSLVDFDFYLSIRDQFPIQFVKEAKVYHHHKSAAIELFLMQFRRGFWVVQIFYNRPYGNKSMTMFQSLRLSNAFLFPLWFLKYAVIKLVSNNFTKSAWKEIFYKLLSEMGWRLGNIRGLVFRVLPF